MSVGKYWYHLQEPLQLISVQKWNGKNTSQVLKNLTTACQPHFLHICCFKHMDNQQHRLLALQALVSEFSPEVTCNYSLSKGSPMTSKTGERQFNGQALFYSSSLISVLVICCNSKKQHIQTELPLFLIEMLSLS